MYICHSNSTIFGLHVIPTDILFVKNMVYLGSKISESMLIVCLVAKQISFSMKLEGFFDLEGLIAVFGDYL